MKKYYLKARHRQNVCRKSIFIVCRESHLQGTKLNTKSVPPENPHPEKIPPHVLSHSVSHSFSYQQGTLGDQKKTYFGLSKCLEGVVNDVFLKTTILRKIYIENIGKTAKIKKEIHRNTLK